MYIHTYECLVNGVIHSVLESMYKYYCQLDTFNRPFIVNLRKLDIQYQYSPFHDVGCYMQANERFLLQPFEGEREGKRRKKL